MRKIGRGDGVDDFGFCFCLERLWETKPIRTKMPLKAQVRTGLMGGKQIGFGDYEQSTAKK